MNEHMYNVIFIALLFASFALHVGAIWAVHSRDRYIRKLEQRVRTLTLRVWESKDGLHRHSAFVPIYMSDDAEPESLHGVHLKEIP